MNPIVLRLHALPRSQLSLEIRRVIGNDQVFLREQIRYGMYSADRK